MQNLGGILGDILDMGAEPSRILMNFLRDLLESENTGFAIYDSSLRFAYVSQSYLDVHSIKETPDFFYGMEMADFLGKYLWNKDPDVIRSGGLYLVSMVRNSRSTQSRLVNLPNGRQYIATGVPFFRKNGAISCIFTLVNDLTELPTLHSETMPFYKHVGVDTLINPFSLSSKHRSPGMLQLDKRISSVLDTNATILITGDSGTGKTVMANYIHANSPRASKPCIHVNCSAIPEALMESELFGYMPGSFSGAGKNGKKGLIDAANNATLFLDEIGDMPLGMQSKLLVFLQEGYFYKVGSTERTYSDVRIIAATNQNLTAMIKAHTFREDLYYRLNVMPIKMPPLRDRRQEILALANEFLDRYNAKYSRHRSFDFSAQYPLLLYQWPGNIRELQHLVERLVISAESDVITGAVIQEDLAANGVSDMQSAERPPASMKDMMDEAEREFLLSCIDRFTSARHAARELGISHTSVENKLKRYGIVPKWRA